MSNSLLRNLAEWYRVLRSLPQEVFMRMHTYHLAGPFAVLSALTACRTAGADSPASLAAQVTIRRDTYGVPHIQAATKEAAALATGYAQAKFRTAFRRSLNRFLKGLKR